MHPKTTTSQRFNIGLPHSQPLGDRSNGPQIGTQFLCSHYSVMLRAMQNPRSLSWLGRSSTSRGHMGEVTSSMIGMRQPRLMDWPAANVYVGSKVGTREGIMAIREQVPALTGLRGIAIRFEAPVPIAR